MKNSLSILAALMVSFAASAFANGETNSVTSENRTEHPFYGVVVASNVNVVLSQGDETAVRVEAAKADLGFINTKVINGSLVVSVRNNYRLTAPATIYVTVNDINLIEVIGNGKVKATQMINADMLTLKVKGNGSINVDVRALTVGATLNGCGSINISGNAANSIIKVMGRGYITTDNFNCLNKVEMIDGTPVDCTAMKRNAELRIKNEELGMKN